jgi:hypothetical protein
MKEELIDEIIFLQTLKKQKSANPKEYMNRLKELFLVGDISKEAYEVMGNLCKVSVDKPKTPAKKKTTTDGCGHTITVKSGGC